MPRAASSAHFKQLRDWSKRKHAILEGYLPVFCRALSKQVPKGGSLWYVDGYAGAGIYRDADNPDDPGECGSPVLAARITQELPYPIKCHNVEEDDESFESLQRETASFPHVTNTHDDFRVVVDDVLKKVAGCPAFFFLDSFGTKELPMENLVDRIAMRRNPTDILLRYATEAVRRLAASYEKDPVRGVANARHLDRWFSGQEWRTIIQQHTGNNRDTELIRYYLRQLITISNRQLKFACSYPIRSIEGTTKYHLIFATGDQLGMKIMSDVLFQAETKYEQDHEANQKEKELKRRGGQMSLFDLIAPDPTAEVTNRIQRLKQSILEQGKNKKPHWEFESLWYTLMAGDWFAQSTEREFRAACKELHAEGKIERLSSNNAWSRGTQFIIHP